MKKPDWLKKKINIKEIINFKNKLSGLATICEEALCPNISECFQKKQATFLILGKICTRKCLFCRVKKTEKPLMPDLSEPNLIAKKIKELQLHYVVITSPTRDDLPDFGAKHFSKVIQAIKQNNPNIKIEILVPDFQANTNSIKTVIKAKPDIFGHNLETVPRLYEIRKGANYHRSLQVLQTAKELNPQLTTKSALILGLGETKDEVIAVLNELRQINCDHLNLGQYLAPSKNHYPIKEFITPEQFLDYKNIAIKMGFSKVESNPFVRSSYQS